MSFVFNFVSTRRSRDVEACREGERCAAHSEVGVEVEASETVAGDDEENGGQVDDDVRGRARAVLGVLDRDDAEINEEVDVGIEEGEEVRFHGSGELADVHGVDDEV